MDIPADDYLTSKNYICKMGFNTNYAPKLNDLIGPHERRYMNLMKNGRKPLALIDRCELPFWKQEIENHNYGVMKVSDDEYIIYLSGLERRAVLLNRIINEYDRFQKPELYHVKLGYLLGYNKRCIKAFLIRVKLIQAGRDQVEYNAAHLITIPQEEDYEHSS